MEQVGGELIPKDMVSDIYCIGGVEVIRLKHIMLQHRMGTCWYCIGFPMGRICSSYIIQVSSSIDLFNSLSSRAKKPVVFLQHGILSASDD